MTNKEAIQWLKPIIKMYSGRGYYDTNRREALELAIKILEERPQEESTSDDEEDEEEFMLTKEQLLENWENGYFSNKEEYRDGND